MSINTNSRAFGSGVKLIVGEESTWGTSVAGDEQAPLKSEGLDYGQRFLKSEYLGNTGIENLNASVVEATGPIELEAVVDEITGDIYGVEQFIKWAMGAAAWDATNSVNKYQMADSLPSFTAALDKIVTIWEQPGSMIKSLKMAGEVGGKITITIETIGKTILFTGDAGIANSASEFTAIAPTNKPGLLLMQNAVFRVGDRVDALASGDQKTIKSFELTIDNALTEPQYGTPDSTHTNALFGLKPERDGERAVSLKVVVPYYHEQQFFTWAKADTALQADLVFTQSSDSWNIMLPNVKISEPIQAKTPGRNALTQEVMFTGMINNGNTDLQFTDATSITGELGIEIASNRTAAP